jgi:hypothetical protein
MKSASRLRSADAGLSLSTPGGPLRIRSCARGISGEKFRQLIRHDSEEMTEHYSDFHLEMLRFTGFF